MSTRAAANQLVVSIRKDITTTYAKLALKIKSPITFKGLLLVISAYSGVIWLFVGALITESAKDSVIAVQTDMAWVANSICATPPAQEEEYIEEAPEEETPSPPAPVKKKTKVKRTSPDDVKPVMPTKAAAKTTAAYIQRYAPTAVQEMKKYGIPASISLAQGILESRNGTSKLALQNNNHFGIKCFAKGCRPGHCTNHHDDHHKDFFRKYKTAWESWRAHSQMLAKGRYFKLKKHGKNYRAWARGLEQLGYATDPTYSEKLIGVIERYELHKYDNSAKLPAKVVASATRVKAASYTLAAPR